MTQPIIPATLGSPIIARNRLTDLARVRNREFDTSYTSWEPVGAPGSVAAGTADAEFQNGWDNVGGGNPPASFHLSEDGKVWIRGAVQGGATGTIIFVLPDYARPEFVERFLVGTETAGRGATIDVSPGGAVTFVG